MLSISVPGSQSLTEMAATIEFIKIISTSEGLKDTLEKLAADKKAIEDGTANLNNGLAKLSDRETGIVDRETQAQAKLDAADGVLKTATRKMDEANELMAKAVQQNSDLDNRIIDFNTAQDNAKRYNDNANNALQNREDNCRAWEESVVKSKREYDDKLTELKKITG